MSWIQSNCKGLLAICGEAYCKPAPHPVRPELVEGSVMCFFDRFEQVAGINTAQSAIKLVVNGRVSTFRFVHTQPAHLPRDVPEKPEGFPFGTLCTSRELRSFVA